LWERIKVRGKRKMGNNLITEAAKELRRRQTEAEKILWLKLKNKQLCGVKFRRQEPIGNFVVDFVSFEKKLIIEVDGNPHREKTTKLIDDQRTIWLREEGFRVLRFWNSDVLDNTEKVLKKLKKELG
jgi:very-short-patch-repair endonuclease